MKSPYIQCLRQDYTRIITMKSPYKWWKGITVGKAAATFSVNLVTPRIKLAQLRSQGLSPPGNDVETSQ